MIRRKYRYSALAVLSGLILSITAVFAAFNDVQFSENTTFQLGSGSIYTFMSDTLVEAITTGDTTFSITVRDASYIRMRSSDRQLYTVTGSSCQSANTTCETGYSQLIIDCTNGPSQHTLTVKPEGACASASSGSSGGGGGALFSSPGGGGFTFDLKKDTATTTKKETVKKTTEPVKPAAPATPEITKPTTACALTTGKAYKTFSAKAVYYVTSDCTKRAFNNARMFFTYFTSWNDVKTTSAATLTSVPNDALGFMPHGPLYDPQYGALVKIVKDPKVYLLLGGKRHWITDENVFNSLKYPWNWIEDVAEELLNKYDPAGEITEVAKHPNYTLVKYAGSAKVYRLEPKTGETTVTVKRHIKNEDAFKALNFRWDRIVVISTSEVYADGPELTGTTTATTNADTETEGAAEVKATAPSSDESTPVFTTLLTTGSTGDEVKALQTLLKKLGFFPADIEPTGLFGPTTAKAVTEFQTAKGIDAVGFVGAKTREALNAAL